MIQAVKEQRDIETNKLQGYVVNGNMFVPIDNGNTNYREVQEWIDDGNIPEPAFTFEEIKAYRLNKLSNETKSYIEKFYPEIKQRSDTNDKEFFGAWLISHFPDVYTSDSLYQKMFVSAARIIENTSDFATELTNLKEVTTFANADEEAKYALALEQLLKVSIRQGWVQACKAVHAEYAALLEAATDQAALDAVNIDNIVYPEYPL